MKKIKAIWAKLFNRPRYIKPDPSQAGKFQIIEVDPDGASLTTALGISDERAQFLAKKVHERFFTSENVVQVMKDVSPLACHANELYFLGHVLANLQRDQRMPAFLRSILDRE